MTATWAERGIAIGGVVLSITTFIFALILITEISHQSTRALYDLADQAYGNETQTPSVTYVVGDEEPKEPWDSEKIKGWTTAVGIVNIVKAVVAAIIVAITWRKEQSSRRNIIWCLSTVSIVYYGTISGFILAHTSDPLLLSEFLMISVVSEILIMVAGFAFMFDWNPTGGN